MSDLRQQIDAYLLGELQDAEHRQFERILATDEGLQIEVDFRRRVMHGIYTVEHEDLRRRMDAIHNEVVAPTDHIPHTVRRRPWIITILTVIVLAGLAFLLWQTYTSSKTDSTVFASYYEPFPFAAVQRGDDDSVLFRAEAAYSRAEYERAAALFESYLEADSVQSLGASLALANSLIQNEQIPAAINRLNDVLRADDDYFTDAALWYKALAYLKLAERPSAIEALRQIIRRNHDDFYVAKSQQLLSDLRAM